MVADGWVLGVDFGTSFTVAANCRDGERPALIDLSGNGSVRMPSCVWCAEDGKLIVGADAARRAVLDPGRFVRAPKRLVGREDGVLFGGKPVTVQALVAAVLGRVHDVAWAEHGGTPPGRVVLTCPAAWAEPKRNVLKAAARQAGLGEADLIDEPVAAAAALAGTDSQSGDGGLLGVYDLGGGTFDVAVLRRDQAAPGGHVVHGPPGGLDPLGGDRFDQQLLKYVARNPPLSEHPDTTLLLDPPDQEWRQYRWEMDTRVRDAKEALSRDRKETIRVPGLNENIQLNRDQLEEVIRPDVEKTITRFNLVLRQADITPSDLTALYLTGASSRIPLIPALLAGTIDVSLLKTNHDPKAIVALGATIAAQATRTSCWEQAKGVRANPRADKATRQPSRPGKRATAGDIAESAPAPTSSHSGAGVLLPKAESVTATGQSGAPAQNRALKAWIIVAGAVAVVAAVCGIAALAHHRARSALAVEPLNQIIRPDVTTCSSGNPERAMGLSLPGLAIYESCGTSTPYGLKAFQFKNTAAYANGLNLINTYTGWDPVSAAKTCPASTGSTQGLTQWSNAAYPPQAGQVLECHTQGQLAQYVWTIPTQRVILWVTWAGASQADYASLNAWWKATQYG